MSIIIPLFKRKIRSIGLIVRLEREKEEDVGNATPVIQLQKQKGLISVDIYTRLMTNKLVYGQKFWKNLEQLYSFVSVIVRVICLGASQKYLRRLGCIC